MAKTRKPRANVRVTGRTIAYVQEVGKGKKLGKPKTVMLTTVRVGVPAPAKKTRRKRK